MTLALHGICDQRQLIDQTLRPTNLINDEEYIANVTDDATLIVGEVLNVTRNPLPVAIKVDTDEVAILIKDWATGVTTGRMGSGTEVHRHLIATISLLHRPAATMTIALVLVDLLETVWDNELP